MNSTNTRLSPLSKILILLLFFTISLLPAFAQDDLKIENIEGKKYYIHKIEQGHTLYAISKKYLVEIEDIINENPEVKDGLKIDQVLKIPVIKENKKLHKINNPELEGNFILHTIEKGQTLYSLSKLYDIDIVEIIIENPEVEMQVGHVLKIPVDKIRNIKNASVSPAKEDINWIKHIVIKGETKYSLAKKYNVNMDSIDIINDGLIQGLKEGDTINIPIKRPSMGNAGAREDKGELYNYIKEKLKSDTNDSIRELFFQEYKIAVFLPFLLEDNDSILENKKYFHEQDFSQQSLISLEFYEGFLLALDSLSKEGFKAKVHIYDTGTDSVQLNKVLSKPELKKMDLIIGPLYLSGFVQASKFALENKIHIVSPFIQQNSIIASNPFVSKALSDYITQFEQLYDYVENTFSKQNIIVVHKNAIGDKHIVNALMKKAACGSQPVKEFIYKISGIGPIQKALSLTKKNIIIVPSNDQAFVTELITKLNFAVDDQQVFVFGSGKWLKFDNLDLNYLHKLNTHLVTSDYIDYDSPSIKSFIADFRSKYYTDPSMYAFQGFDVGYFYLSLLNKSGRYFSMKTSFYHEGLQVTFDLNKTGLNAGFENKGISIIRYEDFKMVKVN